MERLAEPSNTMLGYDRNLYVKRYLFERRLVEAALNGDIYCRFNCAEPLVENEDDLPKILRLPNTSSVSFYQVQRSFCDF